MRVLARFEAHLQLRFAFAGGSTSQRHAQPGWNKRDLLHGVRRRAPLLAPGPCPSLCVGRRCSLVRAVSDGEKELQQRMSLFDSDVPMSLALPVHLLRQVSEFRTFRLAAK